MKRLWAVTAGLLLFTLNVCAQATDNFDDNTVNTNKWGSDVALGTGGSLQEIRSHLEFTSDNTSDHMTVRPWIYNYGSYTQSWAVSADVHVSNAISLPSSDCDSGVFVCIAPQGEGYTNNSFYAGLGRGRKSGEVWHGYTVFGYAGGTEQEMAYSDAPFSSQGRVSIAFDASSKILTAFYNGALLGSTNIAGSWGLGSSSTFQIGLGGYASGLTYSGQEMYADNFSNSIPVPAVNSISAEHQKASAFTAGSTGTVSVTVTYVGVESAICMPVVPAGWEVVSVQGDGNPSLSGDGNVVWTSSMPASPIRFSYQVAIPAGAVPSSTSLVTRLAYQFPGDSGPSFTNASPDPLSLDSAKRTLTVVSSRGTPVPSVGSHEYTKSDPVNCSVVSPVMSGTTTQYVCTGWSMAGNEPGSGSTNSFSMTITNDASLTWLWITNYSLTTAVSGSGSVDVSSGWKTGGEPVVITAFPDAFQHFTGWSGATSGCTVAGTEITVPMNQARSITASFAIDTYAVTFDLAGHGTRTGGGNLSQTIAHGSAATAPTVQAASGWIFTGWDVSFSNVTGALTVTAQYSREYTLNVASARGTPAPSTGVHADGSTVNCSVATPVVNGTTRYVCDGWTMTGNAPLSGSASSFSMTITNNASLTWLWSTNYYLNTEKTGSGNVNVSDGWKTNGETVVITANPESGDIEFSNWSGDVPPGDIKKNPLTLTMNQARTVTANFTALPDLMLTNAQYTADTYLIGGRIPVSVIETNRGAANAGVFALVGVLSTNADWANPHNVVLGTNIVSGLTAGKALSTNLTFAVPVSAPEGFYCLGLMVDATNGVHESVETNNVWWTASTNIGVTLPPMWSLTPSSRLHDGNPAQDSFAVSQTQGLPADWTAVLNANAQGWTTLDLAYTNGTGSGEVRYSVKTNDTGRIRSGTIQVQNASFMITQATLPPSVPGAPAPGDGATGVDRYVTLRWSGQYALGYEVLFATNAAGLRHAAYLSTTNYQIGTRAKGETYYWQVIATNDAGAVTGAVWNFTVSTAQTCDETLNTKGQNLSWTTAGAAWFSQTNETHDGAGAMQSGVVSNGQQSVMQTVVEGPGVLSFWSRVSADASDVLSFSVNGVTKTNWSGSGDWVQTQIALSEGTQTAKWVYAKNTSASAGADAAWVDEVNWKGENKVVFPVSFPPDTWVAAYIWDYTAQKWIELGLRNSPASLEFSNAQPGCWYWLCVMEWNGSKWIQTHGSWFKRFEGY